MKSIVSDPQSIDNVGKRVERLVIQIENTDFNIFSANHKENWEAIITSFYKEVRKLDTEGVRFIDQSFKRIRSAESALEVLLDFKNLNTRQPILDTLMVKFDVIVRKFLDEILEVEDFFTVYNLIYTFNIFHKWVSILSVINGRLRW